MAVSRGVLLSTQTFFKQDGVCLDRLDELRDVER